MALKGQPSTAHEFSKSGECIHCGMHRKFVEEFVHVCTKARELAEDGYFAGFGNG